MEGNYTSSQLVNVLHAGPLNLAYGQQNEHFCSAVLCVGNNVLIKDFSHQTETPQIQKLEDFQRWHCRRKQEEEPHVICHPL